MNLQEKIKPLYKHLGVLAFFFLLVLIVFYPLFEGQVLEQHDIKMWLGSAKECIDYRDSHNGEETMWTNSMFGGMPSYLISAVYPSNLTRYFIKLLSVGVPSPANKFIVSLICFYICCLCFKIRWQFAIFGAVAFTFTTFNTISIVAGHNSKVMALALIPLMIGGLKLILEKKHILGVSLLALGTSLEIGAGHIQITYYGIMILLGLAITGGIGYILQKDYKNLFLAIGLSIVAGLIGILPHASRLMTLKEYSEYSMRGKSELTIGEENADNGLTRDYVFAYSQGIKENLSIIAPNLFGTGREAWGDRNSYALYFGASTFFLFIVGFFVLKPKEWIWTAGLSVLGIIMAIGKHLPSINYWLYDNLPAYSKFRTVNMTLALTQFTFVLMASLTLNKIFDKDFELTNKIKYGIYTVFGLLGILFISSFMISASADYDAQIAQQGVGFLDSIITERISGFRNSVLRSVVFICSLVALFFIYQKNQNKNKNLIFGVFTTLLLFLDVSTINNKFFSYANFKEDTGSLIHATKADRFLMSKKEQFRVFDASRNTFNDATASYFHHSIGGYHSAKIRRYQDILDNHIMKNNMKVIQMLNTKYVYQGAKKKPQELPVLGNAWFVTNLKSVDSPDEEIQFLDNKDFIPKNMAVYDQSKFKFTKQFYDNSGSIKLTNYEPNKLSYESNSVKAGLAVFSEVFYPVGWNATIDGKLVDIKRVNYILRALEIPSGKHKIEFEFHPSSYYTGEKIALLSSLILITLLIFALYKEIKNIDII